jgi:hypothetical protein
MTDAIWSGMSPLQLSGLRSARDHQIEPQVRSLFVFVCQKPTIKGDGGAEAALIRLRVRGQWLFQLDSIARHVLRLTKNGRMTRILRVV